MCRGLHSGALKDCTGLEVTTVVENHTRPPKTSMSQVFWAQHTLGDRMVLQGQDVLCAK